MGDNISATSPQPAFGLAVRKILEKIIELRATDLHMKVGSPPLARINTQLEPLTTRVLTPPDTEHVARSVMNERIWNIFQETLEADFAYALDETNRFRVNAHRHLGTVALAFRLNRTDILDFDQLGLPPVIKKLSEHERGLVLVTGVTGSGKSTTLATMVNQINCTRKVHIITIEDPIEFIHRDRKGMVTQRELGCDTDSFLIALRHCLRQDPDVILIGEMRDVETIRTAISAAETGHLVFSTLHTVKAATSVERILSFFTPQEQGQVRMQLAENLRGVVSQRLLKKNGGGIVPALEIMVGTPTVRKLISEGKLSELNQAIQNQEDGMQSFNQAIFDLVKRERITEETGLLASDNPLALRRMIAGGSSGGDKAAIIG